MRLSEKFSADIDWVQGGYAMCDESGNIKSQRSANDAVYKSLDDIKHNFDQLEFIYTHNRLINARLKDIRFPIGKAHEDRFWNVEAFPRLRAIICIPDLTYNYIAHPTSFSNKSRASVLYIDSAMELLDKMDGVGTCWQYLSDTFQITAVEKNLYLWGFPASFRKSIRNRLKNRRPTIINVTGFPRFTKLVHSMISNNVPDIIIAGISFVYRTIMNALKKPF